jgi:hypothetical protein
MLHQNPGITLVDAHVAFAYYLESQEEISGK